MVWLGFTRDLLSRSVSALFKPRNWTKRAVLEHGAVFQAIQVLRPKSSKGKPKKPYPEFPFAPYSNRQYRLLTATAKRLFCFQIRCSHPMPRRLRGRSPPLCWPGTCLVARGLQKRLQFFEKFLLDVVRLAGSRQGDFFSATCNRTCLPLH